MNGLCLRAEIAYKNGVSQPRRIALLLLLSTLALYLPVAWFSFVVYDDGLYVTETPTVQAGVTWVGVKWAFTQMAASNWHPVTWLSHMMDCGIFGLNPAGPHLVNALFHAANAALLFVLLLRLTGSFRWGGCLRAPEAAGSSGSRGCPPHRAIWPAAFIAALFAWHPMHVESVAWISERKDVLSTFFALLALLGYADYVQRKRWRSYWISLFCFALGIMAKPMVVTLPCVLLLLDFWPLNRAKLAFSEFRVWVKLLVEKIPFFAVTAGASLLTFIAQSQEASKAVASLDLVSLSYRLKNIPVAYVEYLCKTFWPAKLAVFYPLPETIEMYRVILSIAGLVAISVVAVMLHRSRPYWLTGWLWFLGMLVPVIGLVQVGSAQIADRYSYLPSVGIFIIVTHALLDLADRWRIPGRITGAVAVAVLLACVALMEKQLWYWQNSETLFRHALAVTADNDVARNNLGVALEQQNRLAEAAEQYRAAMKLAPDRYQAPNNLANLFSRQGRHDEALEMRRTAATIDPKVPFLHFSLGQALKTAGQTNEALAEFAEAARLDPQYALPHVERARVYLEQGRDQEAIDELRAAVRLAPDDVAILTYTAQVLATSDNAAIRDGHAALTLATKANLLARGSRPFTLDVLGAAYAEVGRFEDAQMAARDALEMATAMKMTGTEPIQQRLGLYQQHQPWRESFRATNSPVKIKRRARQASGGPRLLSKQRTFALFYPAKAG